MEENERTLYENLEYLNETKGIIKQAIIDKGVEVSADTPFREYADKIGDIQGGSGDLDDVITAQEQYIEELEAIIDEKASGGGSGDGTTMNIFVQTTEPEVKKGIWLEANKTPQYYAFDDEVYVSGTWEPDGLHANIPYNFGSGGTVIVGTNVYIFGSSVNEYTRYAYKYDILNNTWTRLTDIPGSNSTNGLRAAVVGTDAYLFGGGNGSGQYKKAYKYNILTDTYTSIADVPFEFANMSATTVGTDIYLISGNFIWLDYSKQVYKYNTLNNTYTRLSNFPETTYGIIGGSTVAIDTDIYLFGSSADGARTIAYKYDTTRDAYTKLTNIPYNFDYGSAVLIGTDVYLLGGNSNKKNNYKYDTLTGTYTKLTDIPYDFSYGGAVALGTNIYLFKGTRVQVYSLQNKTYEQDNLVVVEQGKHNGIGYSVELYSNPKNVTPSKYQFVDAYYHTTQDGLITNIPTYYGDGTQWVKFKN